MHSTLTKQIVTEYIVPLNLPKNSVILRFRLDGLAILDEMETESSPM